MNYIAFSNRFMGNPDKRIPGLTRRINEFITKKQQYYLQKCEDNILDKNSNIVVSLTTFPIRNNVAYLSIKSLLIQTMMPSEIIVWLASSQYKSLPSSFVRLQEKGVQFKYVDDIKSHKKYYYSLQEYSNKLVVTVDDDLIYPENLLEKLYKKHLEYPKCVVCYRGRTISISNNTINPYMEWKINTKHGVDNPSLLVMPSTGAGVLYPENCLPDEAFNLDHIMEYAPTADDLWMKWMELLNGIGVIKSQKKCPILSHLYTESNQDLASINITENDRVILRLSEKYPEALRRLFDGYQEDKKNMHT